VNEARTIERIPVDSNAFAAIGYDVERQLLSVEFNSGHIWHYRGVNNDAFQAFAGAPSRGSWFAKYIRGKFTAEQMTGLCPQCVKTTKPVVGLVGERCVTCQSAIRAVEAHRKP